MTEEKEKKTNFFRDANAIGIAAFWFMITWLALASLVLLFWFGSCALKSARAEVFL